MTVRNKKTGKEYVITKNDWQRIVDGKYDKLFTVVVNDDNNIKKINVPTKIVEYQKEIKKITKTETNE